MAGDRVKGFRRILDAEVGDPPERDPVALLHHFREIGHGAGALDHVEARPVGAAYLIHPAVAGHARDDLYAHLPVVLLDDPGLSRHVEVAEDVDGAAGDGCLVILADEPVEGLAGRPVAVLLRSLESLRMDRYHRDALLFLDLSCRPPARRRR